MYIDQVEVGTRYVLIMSTYAGMWRYRIGDVIQFTSVDPFRIQIIVRTKTYLNTSGEHVSVSNVDDIIAEVYAEMGCAVKEYMVGLFEATDGKAKHHPLIEWYTPPKHLDNFIKAVGILLQEKMMTMLPCVLLNGSS